MTIPPEMMDRLLVRNVSDYAIYMLAADGTILNWNAGAERAKGYTADEIVGSNFAIFYSPEDRAKGIPAANLAIAKRDEGLRLEDWRLRKDGTRFWAMVTIDPIYDDDGVLVGFAKVTRDLTEKHELMARIEHQATHDSLTGLLNRAGLFRRLRDDIASGYPAAIHCIDLDHFKPVNDRYGHSVGDDALTAVGDRLRRMLDGRGYASRIGGDEFVAVQSAPASWAAAVEFSAFLRNGLEQPIAVADAVLRLGASIGTSLTPEDGVEIGQLLRTADRKLYADKRRRSREHPTSRPSSVAELHR